MAGEHTAAGDPARRTTVLDVRSKAERAADVLADRIRSAELAPGTFLGTKAQLRQDLGISPATMDTALGVLVDRGLVEIRPGVRGGVRVAAPDPALSMGRTRWPLVAGTGDPARAGQAMALYLALQPHVVARAVGSLTARDRSGLLVVRTRLEESVQDPDAYYRAHLDAHRALVEASHDGVLVDVLHHVMAVLDAETGAPQPPANEKIGEFLRDRVAVHVGVIDGVLAGDLDEAWRWLLRHGLTEPDVAADAGLLPPGALALQQRWAAGFTAPEERGR